MKERKDVTCPSCRTVNSAKISGDGFHTLPCSGCKYPIYDMDKYFNIVYNGSDIERMADRITRIKYCVVGVMVLFILVSLYLTWVSIAMYYFSQVPMAMAHFTQFIGYILIIAGFPYLLCKKVLTILPRQA